MEKILKPYSIFLLLVCLCIGLSHPACTSPADQESTTEPSVETKPEVTTEKTQQPDATSPKESTPDIVEALPTEQPIRESSNKTCTFNADCPDSERCECSEQTGCFCRVGVRGKGKNGVGVCKTGQDCETALCNEGNGGLFYCSGPCQTDTDCQSNLPVCANISFLGKVCIRKRS